MNLVIGKFYPPHAGHHHVIERALADGPTVVLVLYSSCESILAYKRVQWLRDAHPNAIVQSARDDHPVDYDSDQAWDNHMKVIRTALRNRPNHLVFDRDAAWPIHNVYGSELYVDRLAKECSVLNDRRGMFGAVATSVIVDIDRERFPVSGTEVRADPKRYWQYLWPSTRVGLCKRIVCMGAESCGTTTLAKDLAQELDTVWVPEYGRTFSEGFHNGEWTHEALGHIASAQLGLENQMARHTRHGLLICDTNTLATAVWEEFLVGPSRILPTKSDLYILTDLCPWEDDGTRMMRHQRVAMQKRFVDKLNKQDVPWIDVSGTPSERVQKALSSIDQLTWEFAPPLPEN